MWTAEDYLAHSAKGTSWEKKDHKYIKKVDGKYYYKEDLPHIEAKEKIARKAFDAELRRGMNEENAKTMYKSASDWYKRGNKEKGDADVQEAGMYANREKGYEKVQRSLQNQEYIHDKNLEYNESHRSLAARAEMKLAEIGDKIKETGESFLKKLGFR